MAIGLMLHQQQQGRLVEGAPSVLRGPLSYTQGDWGPSIVPCSGTVSPRPPAGLLLRSPGWLHHCPLLIQQPQQQQQQQQQQQ